MASRLIGRFCRLGQQQQFLDLRVHGQKPEIDWDEVARDLDERIKAAIEFARRDDEEYYKTHPRQGRGRPGRPNREN
jgi:hypothetical protein